MAIEPELEGRVALVTGGNHGIGAAAARALAAQGASVLVTYLRLRRDPDEPYPPEYVDAQRRAGELVADEIVAGGGRAVAREADLNDANEVPRLFDWAEATFGPIEVLVNNAAHCRIDSFAADRRWLQGEATIPAVTGASLDEHFAVNTRAPALMIAEFARRHAARGAEWGRIVNVSTDGAFSFPGEVSYGATKYALESLSRSAAAELGPLGITVNTVSPGPIQTGWMSDALVESVASASPLQRVGEPEDVADVIVFLASRQGRWLTGQTLHAGGGNRMS